MVTTSLQDCPRCNRRYLEADPVTGWRSCLTDCGYWDEGDVDPPKKYKRLRHEVRQFVRALLLSWYWRLD